MRGSHQKIGEQWHLVCEPKLFLVTERKGSALQAPVRVASTSLRLESHGLEKSGLRAELFAGG